MPLNERRKSSTASTRRRKKFRPEFVALLLGIVFVFRWWTSSQSTLNENVNRIPRVMYKLASDPNVHVLGKFPHDKHAFTQGLLVESPGILIESTGLYKRSSVRRVNATSGKSSHHTVPFDSDEFGEGITWNAATQSYIVLTWKARKAYVLDKEDFRILSEFQITTTTRNEGWGITTIDETNELIISDGSHVLHIWDPTTYQEKRRISVLNDVGQPITNLNELEYARGYIFANIWYSNLVAQIDPSDGRLVKLHDLSSLSMKKNSDGDVLNGIAYDKFLDVFYITGKLWDSVYMVQIITSTE